LKLKSIILRVDFSDDDDDDDDNNNNNNNNNKELQRMWNLRGTIIPVMTGATGIVTRSLRRIWKRYQENIR
jgi:hypothetical protein